MPVVNIDGQDIEVPEVIPGRELRNLPQVRKMAKDDDSAYLIDPESGEMEPIVPGRDYRPKNGWVVEHAPRSERG